MTRPVAVRARRVDDLPACVELLARVHAADAYPMRPAAVSVAWLTTPSDRAWVTVDRGRVLGHVALVPHPDAGVVEVSRLFTDPDSRGRGIARALLRTAVEQADGTPVVLEAVEGTDAVGFYARAGWLPAGTHVATWTAPDGTHPTLRTFTWPAGP